MTKLGALPQELDGPAYLKAMETARGKLRFSPAVRVETVLAVVRKAVARFAALRRRSGDVLAFGVPVIGRTEGMVTQDFDHPAIGNAPARALNDHSLKLGL